MDIVSVLFFGIFLLLLFLMVFLFRGLLQTGEEIAGEELESYRGFERDKRWKRRVTKPRMRSGDDE